jgi:hypothetical protein
MHQIRELTYCGSDPRMICGVTIACTINKVQIKVACLIVGPSSAVSTKVTFEYRDDCSLARKLLPPFHRYQRQQSTEERAQADYGYNPSFDANPRFMQSNAELHKHTCGPATWLVGPEAAPQIPNGPNPALALHSQPPWHDASHHHAPSAQISARYILFRAVQA